MVCLRNICINTLHKGDNGDDDGDDDNNNNNNNLCPFFIAKVLVQDPGSPEAVCYISSISYGAEFFSPHPNLRMVMYFGVFAL